MGFPAVFPRTGQPGSPFTLQHLERRVLLSAAAPADDVALPKGFVEIEWHGQTRHAKSGEWILKLDNVTGKSRGQISKIDRLLDNAGIDADVLRHLNADGTVLLETPGGTQHAKLDKAFRRITGFKYLEPNFAFRIAGTPTDSRFAEQWALHNTGQSGGTPDADIDALEAWDFTTGDPSVVVGVIDTGVDYNHPDLAANVWTNPGEIPNDQIDNDDNGFVDDWRGWDFANDDNDAIDDNGHGTHVAGIIAAVGNNGLGVSGVSWNAKVLPLKFTDKDGFGEASSAIAAINYANLMAARGANVRVTNSSWGGFEFSAALRDAFAGGENANVLHVAAAGNDASDNDVRAVYPAAFQLPSLITVAATDDSDQLLPASNYGETSVHVAAPGENILSTIPGVGYMTATGSSYAAPHAAGVAALAWGVDPDGTVYDIRDAVEDGGDFVPALDGKISTGRRVSALGTLMKLPMRVLGVTPGADQVVATRPTEFVVRFSHPVTAASLQAADLTVNGVPASTVQLTDPRSATFRFNATPVTAEGAQAIRMLAGRVTRSVDGLPVQQHESSLRYDAAPLRIISSSPASGTIAALPLLHIDVNFSESPDPATVGTDDLVLSQGAVARVSYVDEDTVRYALTGVTREGALRYDLPAGAVADVNGGPSRAYIGQVQLDIAESYPLTLAPVQPGAHGVHEDRFDGAVSPPGDADSFTLTIPLGRRLSFALDGGASLAPRITVRSGAGAFLGTAAAGTGGNVAVQNVASPDGAYVITVAGDVGTTGAYHLRVVSDSTVETEDHGGARNDSPASAQSLDAVLRTLGGNVQGAAVAGRVDLPSGTLPSEQEPNNSTGAANSGRQNFITRPEDRYQIGVKANLSTGSDSDYYKIGRLHAGDVLTVAISGAGSSRGTLGDPFLELYAGDPQHLVRIHEDDDGGPHTDSLIYRYRVGTDDTYYVHAKAYAMDTGSYDLAIYLEDFREPPETFGANRAEQEPNDSTGSATDLSTSWQQVRHVSTTAAAIASASDRDFYTYDFRKGDLVTIRLDAQSQADAKLTLSGPSGAVVASDDGTSLGLRSGAGIFSFIAPSSGRYYLEVSARSGFGTYTKNVEVAGLTPPTQPADASDYYSVTLAPGELVSVAVADQADTHVAVELYDPAGVLVARGTDGGALFDQAIGHYLVQEPGRYSVRITGDRLSQYQLLLTRGAGHELGNNNSPETAQDLGDVHAIVGDLAGANDHYRFDANAGATIDVRTFTPETAGPNGLDPYVFLVAPNGTVVAQDLNSAQDGRNAALSYTAAVAGTYRVMVGSQFGTGPYVLQIGGNVLSGLDGTEGSDTFYIRSGNGDELQVYRNAAPTGVPTFVLSRSGTSRLRINGRGGDDLFVVDLSRGSPIPPGGASFDGGAGNDRLRLTGTSASHDVTVGTNRVQFGPSQITYTTMGSVGLDALPEDSTIDLGSLSINGSGRVALVQGSGKVLKLPSLSITDDGVLDLTDNRLLFTGDAGSRAARLADLTSLVKKARNAPGGRWTGNGITSSLAVNSPLTGLAVMPNDNGSGGALINDFGGASAGVSDVLVRYTYNGDASMDGRINADDYFRIDQGFLAQPANPTYRQGDFNYDGRINADDYFLIDQAFLGQGLPLNGSIAASATSAVAAEEPAARKTLVRTTDDSLFSTTRVRRTARRAGAK
jgi:subtilisin family serine protease